MPKGQPESPSAGAKAQEAQVARALALLGQELEGMVVQDLERIYGSEWRREGARLLNQDVEKIDWRDPGVVLGLLRHAWSRHRATFHPLTLEDLGFLISVRNMSAHHQSLGKRRAGKAIQLILKLLKAAGSPAWAAASAELAPPKPPVLRSVPPSGVASPVVVPSRGWVRYVLAAGLVALLMLAAYWLDALGRRTGPSASFTASPDVATTSVSPGARK